MKFKGRLGYKSSVKHRNTLSHLDQYMAETVILQNSHAVKESRRWFCLIQISTTVAEAPFHFGCAFSVCTGVEAVKQSLGSIESNQGLIHSLNAHHHNAKK